MRKQVVNVCDLGADASGRVESFAAFQTAFQEAQRSGCDVLIPAGRYRLSGKVELSAVTEQTESPDSVGE